ncbi:GGDEF domain-containing protein [Oleomonas cavernae]|uniref:diguanylate cyclase n=1 Tax=Oleomonas cavernae TaxID=2320859 RepID=A0A418W9A7_9PROT|nr:GGDEF domain-containing protein [Oleomonas cavernae]RJF86602.1 GGDEF domain-containing protein [Oleomonas cavernae]
MSLRDQGKSVEERAVRPMRTAIAAAGFAFLITNAVFLLLVVFLRHQIERETDIVGQFLAAHLADGARDLDDQPATGKILALSSVSAPLPDGEPTACTERLAAWYSAQFPDGDQTGIAAFVRPICQGRVANVGYGRRFGVVDVLIRRAGPTGQIMVDAVTVRRSDLSAVDLVVQNPRLPVVAAVVALLAGIFAYFMRRQPYRLYLAARQNAATDGLSGVLRREEFFAGAEELVRDARLNSHAVSLLALDIDHFKSVNDRFGHAAGDEVIRICGNLISATVRGGDLVGRIGGEEFMVLLPDLPKFIGAEVADRLRKRIKSHGFAFGDETFFATVSIGVSSMMQADTLQTLAERADRRLYQAKRTGRNRVVWEDEDNFDY